MPTAVVTGFVIFLCANSFAAELRWSHLATADFDMYTTSGERSARDTLRYFEQVRGVFAQAVSGSPVKSPPVRIVAFSSLKEYEPYRLNEFAIAYYHSSGDRDYIVMSHTGAETFPIAIHEYVHLVVRHANMKLPPWLNEGLAELYSTLRPTGDKILVGSLIPGRYQALLHEKWVPLETILHAGQDSPYYNEKDKAGSLYNEGWALTHMLVLGKDYRPKFSQFLALVAHGTDSVTALEQVYRVPLKQIESELQRYLRGGQFQGFLIPAKFQKPDEELHAEPADPFEVNLLLAEIGDRGSREEATRTALEALIHENPNRPEPYVDLGYLDWRMHDRDGARRQFEKAFDLGGRSPRMLWDFARMEESADRSRAIAALGELLKQEPDRIDARLELAAAQLGARDAKQALVTLAAVKKVEPEDAPRLFLLMAHADLEAGDREDARNAAQRLKQYARNDDDRARADEILQFLDRGAQARAAGSPPPEDGRPVIRRRQAAPFEVTEKAQENTRASFVGEFVELQCTSPARIVLDTPEGKKVLAIDDPTLLVVNGHNGETKDLSCGPQKPEPVRIEYDPDAKRRAGIDGVARVIHFDAK